MPPPLEASPIVERCLLYILGVRKNNPNRKKFAQLILCKLWELGLFKGGARDFVPGWKFPSSSSNLWRKFVPELEVRHLTSEIIKFAHFQGWIREQPSSAQAARLAMFVVSGLKAANFIKDQPVGFHKLI